MVKFQLPKLASKTRTSLLWGAFDFMPALRLLPFSAQARLYTPEAVVYMASGFFIKIKT